jgi:superfamily I DNA/RNA helicase
VAGDIAIHTFHSLGLAILREHPAAAGLHRGFHIADEQERIGLLAARLDVSPAKAETLLRAISKARRSGAPANGEIAEAIAAYREAKQLRDAVDFDDLVALTIEALSTDPALLAHYRARWRHVSVDEFQDVDEQQLRLLALLAPSDICVIGDPDQAIYGFRGADASCFARFGTEHPDARTVRLGRNYRSTGTIVAASAQLIGAVRSQMETIAPIAEMVRDMHERITLHAAPTERAEAEFVVATIERMIGGHSFFSLDSGRSSGVGANLSFADFAVLYRTDAQSEALIEALARSGMPFKKHGAGWLADDAVVRALLRHADGAASRDGLAAAAEKLRRDPQAPDDTLIRLAVQRLTTVAESAGFDPARFADALALTAETDLFDPRADRVSLLTIHAAKGLEFPVVFVVGLEDGLLPLSFGAPDPASLAEERRLLYVGMTRAKDRLLLSRAERRTVRGRVREQSPSRFLADIERELLRQQTSDLPRRRPEAQQLSLF